MSDNKFTARNTKSVEKSKYNRDKFLIGKSEACFETAEYLKGKMVEEDVTRMLKNPNTKITETMGTGKSLNVTFYIPNSEINEVKHLGFITACDAKITLCEEDIPRIMEYTDTIVRAINTDALIALF